MSWLPILVSGWLVCSVALALLIGRSIGLADRKARDERERLYVVDDIPLPRRPQPDVAGGRPPTASTPLSEP
jgi:hypothetical protein